MCVKSLYLRVGEFPRGSALQARTSKPKLCPFSYSVRPSLLAG